MGSQGTTQGTKRNIFGSWENPSYFLLDFMKSYQDFTFSIRIQDGIQRGNQRDETENIGQVEKTLAALYLIL